MEDLKIYYDTVEEALTMAGIDPVQCRSEADGQWNLKKDTLEVWIDVLHIEQNKRTYLQIMCPIAQVPENGKSEFFEELLGLNYQMIDANFCVFEGGAYIKIMREIEHLRADDILLAINRIGYYGTVNEKEILEKFNTQPIPLHD